MSHKIRIASTVLLITSVLCEAQQIPPKIEESPLQRALETAKVDRLDILNRRMKSINMAKVELKAAMIADDQTAIAQCRENIEHLQSVLRMGIDSPVSNESLNPLKLKAGQVGILGGRFKVTQILNKSKGEILVFGRYGQNYTTLKIAGVDTTNLVDDVDYRFSGCVVVVGTYTYQTVTGGEKTIFELYECPTATVFTKTELKPFREAVEPQYEIALTDAETAKMESVRKAKSLAETERKAARDQQQRLLDAEAAKKEVEAKMRRSKSYLDSGKALLKTGNVSGARKQFEKAVAESPDSPSAQDAKKLLSGNP